MYKGALIGFGAVAENGHVPALLAKKDVFKICAVAEPSEERRAAAERFFPGVRAYASLDALLENEKHLDFADIASPPVYHFSCIKKCLKAKLNVLCEKPLVFKHNDFAALAKLAAEKKRALFTVHNWKYAPPMVKARELIEKGLAGNVLHVELHVLRNQPSITAGAASNWRHDPKLSGGGIMTDHGWHNFYLAYCLAKGRPVSITASFSYPERNALQVEQSCSCQLEFLKDGSVNPVTAEIFLTWQSPVRKNWCAVYGTAGVIEIRDDIVILERKGQPEQIFSTGEKLSGGSAHPTWMAGLLDEFARALANPGSGTENLREAEACVALLNAGYKSAKAGRRQAAGKLTFF
ncbi:MAG: Gfo/Idh/MocA family oxidoreductase [Elusimicrobiaceae bacterium]